MNAVRSTLAFAMVLAATATAQQAAAPPLTFEVVSIRIDQPKARMTYISPRGNLAFVATGISIGALIGRAYEMNGAQIDGLPQWSSMTSYSITAKPVGDKPLTEQQFQLALQQLLAQRFHLAVHRTVKQVSGYALVVAKGKEPKLEPGKGGLSYSDSIQVDRDGFEVYSTTLQRFAANGLQFFVGAPVVDETQIPGNFHIKLKFNPNNNPDLALPSIYTALEEQLGLKLVAKKVSQETIVVDHVDREPVEN